MATPAEPNNMQGVTREDTVSEGVGSSVSGAQLESENPIAHETYDSGVMYREPHLRGSRRHLSAKSNRSYSQAALIGAAAAGLLAGIAATVGRRAAVQASSAMAGDWFDTLKAEHAAVRKLLDRIEATTSEQTTKRTLLLMQIKHAISKHAFEEENVVYPALRDHDERQEADHLNHDHGYIKQYLYDLEQMPKASALWLEKIREFRAHVEHHMREEETTIFPALRARLTRQDNSQLTAAMHKAGFKLA